MLDLSQEFHPVPKPNAKAKAPKTKAWTEKRDELKERFEKAKIIECELKLKGCWKNTALGFAHLDKRRKLTIDDLDKVVLACNPCHGVVEVDPDMANILQAVIDKRTIQP